MAKKIKKEEENLEEISSSSGGLAVSAQSGSGINKKKTEEKDITEEEQELKLVVKEIIKNVIRKKINEERQLRTIIKTLILEAKKDIEDTPHSSTAINLLEDLLKQLLPNLESEYKTLTTSKEQRDSFRAHVVHAVSSLLETEDVNKSSGLEDNALIDLEEQEDADENINIKVADTEIPADDKFIDIDPPEELPPEEEDTFGIEGQNETGRALAQDAFNNIEKNIAETYAILHDEGDEKLFKDYLITNLKLYFDKWEKELGAVTEPTTDEYEAEKSNIETGEELGGEIPPPAPGEELIQ